MIPSYTLEPMHIFFLCFNPTFLAISAFFIGLFADILALCFFDFITLFLEYFSFLSSVHHSTVPPVPPSYILQTHCPIHFNSFMRSYSYSKASFSVLNSFIILLSQLYLVIKSLKNLLCFLTLYLLRVPFPT